MRYVVMFRGINVGGKHIVKMDELKKAARTVGIFTCVFFPKCLFQRGFRGENKFL